MGLLDWFAQFTPSAAQVRAEVWSLGVRHRGNPLEGALLELASGPLTAARTALLKACVAQMRRA